MNGQATHYFPWMAKPLITHYFLLSGDGAEIPSGLIYIAHLEATEFLHRT